MPIRNIRNQSKENIMPNATKKVTHTSTAKPQKQEHHRRKFYWEGYHTRRWRKERLRFFQHQPACVVCAKEGKQVPAEVVDHVIPIQDGHDPWDDTNWQGLCKYHDASKRGKTKRPGRGSNRS